MKLKLGLPLYLFLSIALIHPIAAQENELAITRSQPDSITKFEVLLQKANEGDASAQLFLGNMYWLGNGVPKDSTKAAKWFQKAAEQNDAVAQYFLGKMYFSGDGVPKDSTKAVQWILRAAEQGNADAQYVTGQSYELGTRVPKDLNKAVEWYQKAAEHGIVDAQVRLGDMYFGGYGVPKDLTKAGEWFQKAAEQGNVYAQYILGGMYFLGDGVTIDNVKAAGWYQKSAEQGNADAQYMIGLMYKDGAGVPVDNIKAVEWLQKAAEQGEVHAQADLGIMYMEGEGVARDDGKSVEWCLKAAEQGNAFAQTMIATDYANGYGTTKDDIKAAAWYRKAAIQGEALGQASLGGMYMDGRGVSKDYMRAYVWFLLSAAQGDATGKRNLSSLEPYLTHEQIAEGQRLASNWKKGDALDGIIFVTALKSASLKKVFTGTAFIISRDGHAITNDHVIHDCTEIKIAGRDGVAKVVTSDSINDLALLQLSGKVNAVASLNPNVGKLRQGEDILVFGYPLNSVLSSGGNLTPGMVSAMTGLGNNTNQIQITAPVQPGSSGSPVIDKRGNVIAVVSMKLDDAIVARFTGSIPQNVNFAINEQTLKTFLDANKVPYKTGSKSAKEKHNADIAEEASKWTVLVECWK